MQPRIVGSTGRGHDHRRRRPDNGAAIKELTPTGKLRVAIAYGPTPSALYTVKDAVAGSGYRSVTIDLSEALAAEDRRRANLFPTARAKPGGGGDWSPGRELHAGRARSSSISAMLTISCKAPIW